MEEEKIVLVRVRERDYRPFWKKVLNIGDKRIWQSAKMKESSAWDYLVAMSRYHEVEIDGKIY